MKGFQIKLFALAILLGIFGSGPGIQSAQAGNGRFLLSKCQLCEEEYEGRQFNGSTYPWPRYSYHIYRGKHCDSRMRAGRYRRYEYDRYQVKSMQPFHGEMLPVPE